MDVNTKLDSFKSVLYSYNLKTNEWNIPITNGNVPDRRRESNGVIDNKTGKFYGFGGVKDELIGSKNTIAFNEMIIFDTTSLTWSRGATLNTLLPRVDFTATLLSNGMIVFIGGREYLAQLDQYLDVDINQIIS
jgi:N-acetylneuraminic acid mutarotase